MNSDPNNSFQSRLNADVPNEEEITTTQHYPKFTRTNPSLFVSTSSPAPCQHISTRTSARKHITTTTSSSSSSSSSCTASSSALTSPPLSSSSSLSLSSSSSPAVLSSPRRTNRHLLSVVLAVALCVLCSSHLTSAAPAASTADKRAGIGHRQGNSLSNHVNNMNDPGYNFCSGGRLQIATPSSAGDASGASGDNGRQGSSVDGTLLALRDLVKDVIYKINMRVDDYITRAWNAAYINYTQLSDEWNGQPTPSFLLVDGIAAENAERPTDSSQQTPFLLNAAERLKRMALALDHAHAGRSEDSFFDDLSSYTQRIVCELNTALALLGVEPPQFQFDSPLPQDSNAKLLFQFRLLRELRAQLVFVQEGVRAVRSKSSSPGAGNDLNDTVDI